MTPPTPEQLEDLHAKWHSCDGNFYGRDECGWVGCEFYEAAEFVLTEVQR